MSAAKPVNVAAMRARLWASRGDVTALQALRADLQIGSGTAVSALLREVEANIAAQEKLQEPPVSVVSVVSTAAPSNETGDLLDRIRNRAKVSDQPLYRYGVSNEEFAALRARLEYLHLRGGLEQANPRTAATFVLYYAEWFRREYDGGGYTWDGPFPAGLSQPARRSLAVDGLRWWGRKPRRSNHAELRLMSLALEGGFPTRVLESRETGRITQHLSRLATLAAAIPDPSEETLESISRSMGPALGAYDHIEFHALCAELILAVLDLKIEARANAPAGVPPIAWLDAARPQWRDVLPIGLPGERAQRLLDELVNASPFRMTGEDAGVSRQLILQDGVWVPRVVVRMAGNLDLQRTMFRPSDGRIRVRAIGHLSDVLSGELGYIEPPTDENQQWMCRARGGQIFEAPYGFDRSVELELRAGSAVVSHPWPGGSAVCSRVMVFVDEGGDEIISAPKRLILLGQGSVRTRRKRVFCFVPANFNAYEGEHRKAVQPFWRSDHFALFEATAPLHLENGAGETYRVDVNVGDELAEHLFVDGKPFTDAEPLDSLSPVFLGSPSLSVQSGTRSKAPRDGEMFWRPVGSQGWLRWQGRIDAFGKIEIVWKDIASGVLRDRITVSLLPPSFSVTCTSLGKFRCRIALAGADGWTIRFQVNGANVSEPAQNQFQLEWSGQPQRRIDLQARGANSEVVDLCLRPRFSAAAFFGRDGKVLEDRTKIMLDDLRGATAFGEGSERLYLRGPAGGEKRIAFRDEVPLWSLSEEIARLLSAGDNLDDDVQIEFGRSADPRLRIGRYSATISAKPDGFILVSSGQASSGQNENRRLEWFSFMSPGFVELARGREYARMPTELSGPGLAVLRDGDRIIGRPTLVQGVSVDEQDLHSRLQRASAETNSSRRGVIDAVIDGLANLGADPDADLAYLHRLVGALDGLPPSAFDPLKSVVSNFQARAIWMTSAVSDEQRAAIWNLERDLPFLWNCTPLAAWQTGFNRQEKTLEALLLDRGIEAPMAEAIATSSVKSAAASLANLDAGLRTVMAFCGLAEAPAGPPPSIFQAAQNLVTRADVDDRDPRLASTDGDPGRASCFRRGELATWLPSFVRFPALYWQALDAPCACAIAAAGHVSLTDQQVVAARAARADDPILFNDMYAATLSVLARGDQPVCEP